MSRFKHSPKTLYHVRLNWSLLKQFDCSWWYSQTSQMSNWFHNDFVSKIKCPEISTHWILWIISPSQRTECRISVDREAARQTHSYWQARMLWGWNQRCRKWPVWKCDSFLFPQTLTPAFIPLFFNPCSLLPSLSPFSFPTLFLFSSLSIAPLSWSPVFGHPHPFRPGQYVLFTLKTRLVGYFHRILYS